ncbi:hypothetical protein B296_00008035 [Ensete ventricosum]|uniref:Leucine-rich repeat-containing N-terminal plant-type domain-containing protein n=1 Tax=Ensete ventricosum TaxID=4639 RepID=A0A427AJ72_ENSVE|nr:hypothetical protein B296_00008035 [Ensete ventricosum]
MWSTVSNKHYTIYSTTVPLVLHLLCCSQKANKRGIQEEKDIDGDCAAATAPCNYAKLFSDIITPRMTPPAAICHSVHGITLWLSGNWYDHLTLTISSRALMHSDTDTTIPASPSPLLKLLWQKKTDQPLLPPSLGGVTTHLNRNVGLSTLLSSLAPPSRLPPLNTTATEETERDKRSHFYPPGFSASAGRCLMATRPPRVAELLLLLPSLLLLFHLLPRQVVSDPDDEACLSILRSSLTDPNGSLRNWTADTFAAPCNGFTSYLEGVTCNNGRVYKLSLQGLSLGGALSTSLANCTNLQSLDLSSNALSGAIPPELASLLNLAVLNLSSNRLSGPIPPELALCAYLNVLDLHANLLTGLIPDQLGLLVRLSTFDVSDNRLEGPIPALLANRTAVGGAAAAALPRFNASSFVGNKDLYGYPLPPKRGGGLSVLAIVGIGLGSGLLSLVLSFTAVCVWLRVTEKAAPMPGEEGKISHLMPDD